MIEEAIVQFFKGNGYENFKQKYSRFGRFDFGREQRRSSEHFNFGQR